MIPSRQAPKGIVTNPNFGEDKNVENINFRNYYKTIFSQISMIDFIFNRTIELFILCPNINLIIISNLSVMSAIIQGRIILPVEKFSFRSTKKG